MREISRLLSLQQLTTTPYHLMANGLIESFNGTLKTKLRRKCAECPKNWDRYALNVSVSEGSTGKRRLSPFELLCGRHVKGSPAIPKELWEKEKIDPEMESTYQYVFENWRRGTRTTTMPEHGKEA